MGNCANLMDLNFWFKKFDCFYSNYANLMDLSLLFENFDCFIQEIIQILWIWIYCLKNFIVFYRKLCKFDKFEFIVLDRAVNFWGILIVFIRNYANLNFLYWIVQWIYRKLCKFDGFKFIVLNSAVDFWRLLIIFNKKLFKFDWFLKQNFKKIHCSIKQSCTFLLSTEEIFELSALIW